MAVPSLTGSITITGLSSTGFTMSWPAATISSGSVRYDLSFNDGFSYPVTNLNATTFVFPSGTPGATYNLIVKAKDSSTGEFADPGSMLRLSQTLPAADTTPPTLSSPTGTSTGATTATGTVSTNEANGTLYRLVSTNATETAATVKAAALTTTVTATGTQSVSFSGLTPSTTYYAHYVHTDAAGNDSTRVSSASFTTSSSADTTPPVLTGAIAVTNLGGNSFTATVPVATDAGGGITYDYSTDGGTTWSVTGWPTPTYNFTGFATGALVQLRVRAKDAAGNYSTPVLSSAVQLSTSPDAPATITTHPQSASVAPGATVTLTYGASGSPVPTRTLQRSTNGGVTWTTVSGAGTTSYTTPALASGDSGTRYRLVATNEIASTLYTATSNEAVITVSAGTGTATVNNVKNGSGTLLTTTLPNVVVLRRSDRAVLLALTNQAVTAGVLTLNNAALPPGAACVVVAFSDDGTSTGAWPATVV